MILHVVHVSGKRMIKQGTDGLSRGDHSTGVMAGAAMNSFIPLHLDAFERSSHLKEWMTDVTQDLNPTFLTPEGWYEDTNQEGTFIWSPPPAAADLVVERLGIAKHKRPNSLHLVVVPRLMTGRWRKHLARATDGYFRIHAPPLWDLAEQFEPVLVFFSLPYLPHRPCFQWRKDLVEKLGWSLQEGGLFQDASSIHRSVLRELLSQAGRVPSL